MYNVLRTEALNDSDGEIKMIPVGEIYVVQIGSGIIRGTLTINNDVEKDELLELAELIYSLMEQVAVTGMLPEGQLPQ